MLLLIKNARLVHPVTRSHPAQRLFKPSNLLSSVADSQRLASSNRLLTEFTDGLFSLKKERLSLDYSAASQRSASRNIAVSIRPLQYRFDDLPLLPPRFSPPISI
jgi:hypothetical protein